MIKVLNVLDITKDKFWRLYGYKEYELMEIIDDDQSYARFLVQDGIKQILQLDNGEIVNTYINLGAREVPYKVGDTWKLK